MGLFKTQQFFKPTTLYTILSVIGLVLLFYFPIFYHLDTLPIFIWDEARLAVNAYEMYESGDYIVTTCQGQPDLWNTKPPLMIWLQVLCMKVFGVNELAVRLPSALAASATILLLVFFAKKILGKIEWGVIASLVLVTAGGYVCIHGIRTGDYDALLTFCKTLYALSFFAFIESTDTKTKNRYFILFFIGLTAAVMTKGIVGFLMCPVLLLYALYRKQVIPIFKNPIFYGGIVGVLSVVFGYVFLREHYNPGYIEAMLENDVTGRYYEGQLLSSDGQYMGSKTADDPWFFFWDLSLKNFKWWITWLFAGLITVPLWKEKRLQRFGIYSIALCSFVLLVVSNSAFKDSWYIMSIYPFLAFIVGSVVYRIWHYIQHFEGISSVAVRYILSSTFILALIAMPYYQMFEFVDNEELRTVPKESYFLQSLNKGHLPAEGLTFLSVGYHVHNHFYLKQLRAKGKPLTLKKWHKIEVGDKIVSYHGDSEKYIKENLEVKTTMNIKGVRVYEVLARKE